MNKVITTFNDNNISFEHLSLDSGYYILISKYGGHIFGPYSDKFPYGILWQPDEILESEEFKKIINKKSWNIGGDRVWISPEIQFNITDRKKFRETLNTPESIDPGNHKISKDNDKVSITQELMLNSHNTVKGKIYLKTMWDIYRAKNPIRKMTNCKELMRDIVYCGYEQVLDLQGFSEKDVYAESWTLTQVRTPGELYIPMYSVERGTDHYEEAKEYQIVKDRGVLLKLTGDRRYKLGFKSICLTGRMGYMYDIDSNKSCFTVINFPNNPSATYTEEPPLREGDRGYSIHIYNDSGELGGFAEMESNMQSICGDTGITHSIDRVSKWFFIGEKKRLNKISEVLLNYIF